MASQNATEEERLLVELLDAPQRREVLFTSKVDELVPESLDNNF